MVIVAAVLASLALQNQFAPGQIGSYRSAFRQGYLDLQAGDLPSAVQHLLTASKAPAAENQRGKVIINSNDLQIFAPNYYLVKAWLQLQSCDDARVHLGQIEPRVAKKKRDAIVREFEAMCS